MNNGARMNTGFVYWIRMLDSVDSNVVFFEGRIKIGISCREVKFLR